MPSFLRHMVIKTGFVPGGVTTTGIGTPSLNSSAKRSLIPGVAVDQLKSGAPQSQRWLVAVENACVELCGGGINACNANTKR